jgi:predicted RNase H-like HicB family nuclease
VSRVTLELHASRRWIATVSDIPGCHTYGSSVAQTLRRVGEAIHLWCAEAAATERGAIEAGAIERGAIEPMFRLPTELQRSIVEASIARERARSAADHATQALTGAALGLVRSGCSVRDAAAVLGLSHQRVHQLLDGG